MKNLEGMSREEQLRSLGLFSLERRLGGDLAAIGSAHGSGGGALDFPLQLKACGNSVKMLWRFWLDVRDRFFTLSVVENWHTLPREVDKPDMSVCTTLPSPWCDS